MRHREGERPIPDYKLEGFLGEGGYGEVWRASGPGGIPCALKFIRLDSNAGLKELKSIGLVKRLRHPNLVPLNAVWLRDEDGNLMGEGDGGESISFRVYGDKELVIAMGLGSGSLADKLAGARAEKAPDALPGGLSHRKLLGYMQDAARGIDCLNDPPAHDNPGVLPLVHCDIKPANLLLVGGGVQVCDYGVAKAVGKDIKKTMAAGTAAYAPPELINNDPGLKSDQYSLAISYYELRTGHLPLDETRAMMAHLMGMLDFDRVPADEREVLQQATAMKVSERFATCEEFVEALQIAGGRTMTAATGAHRFPAKRQPGPAAGDTDDEIEIKPAPPPPRVTGDVLRPSGSPIPGFTLQRLLGQGGYGQVWQAADDDGVACALKVLRDVQGKGRHEYDTLVRLRKLEHPNLLRIDKLWVLDEFWAPIPAEQLGTPHGREARRLVMKTPLADKNLFQKLTDCRRKGLPGIPPAELVGFLRQAADALDYLNIDQQTQHRDVKPENLLLKGEVLWVSDFGLAKVVPPGGVTAQSTSSGMTEEYASPEVLTNRQVTDRSDQYSLAVTYHVLRTGRLPFPNGLSMLELIKARASTSLDLSALPEAERPVLKRALSAHPSDRFPTCRELLRALADAAGVGSADRTVLAQPALAASAFALPRLPAPAAPRPTPHRGTLQFTDDVDLQVHDDPDNTASRPAARPDTPVLMHSEETAPLGRFAREKPAGGNKLLVGGLAALAAAAVGVGGYLAVGRDKAVAGGTSPTGPEVVQTGGAGTTEPTRPDPRAGGTQPTAPKTDTPVVRPKDDPVVTRPADDPRKRAADAVAAGDWRAAQAAAAALAGRTDAPADVRAWAAAWRDVLDEPAAPTAVGLDALAAAAARLDPATTPAGPHRDKLAQKRRDLLTARAAAAVKGFDFADPARWKQAGELLAQADGSDPWVRAGRAEAAAMAGEPAGFDATEPPGYAGYVKGLTLAKAGKPDDAADAVAAGPGGDWLSPARAGTAAGLLAEAVDKARTESGFPPDRTERVARWLLGAAGLAKSLPAAARDRIGVDVVTLAVSRPELKAVAAEQGDLLGSEAVKGLPEARRADFLRAFADTRGADPAGRLAAVRAFRQMLAGGDGLTPEGLAQVLNRLGDDTKLVGPAPTEGVKAEQAGLLADAARRVYRNRGRLAGRAGFGTAAQDARRAAELFGRAARSTPEPADLVAWQGIALVAAGDPVPAAVSRRAGGGPAGLVLGGMLAGRGQTDLSPKTRLDVLNSLKGVIRAGQRDEERFRDELAEAYRLAADHAIKLANADSVSVTVRHEWLDAAVEWGKRLAEQEAQSPAGPTLAGCALEDVGWLLRQPDPLAERCGPAGPYQEADRWLREAVRRGGGKPAHTDLGRNLYKWVQEQTQLVERRSSDAPKAAPDEDRLRQAETALEAAGDAAEPLYWRACAAVLRYEAVERKLTRGDRREAARVAADACAAAGKAGGLHAPAFHKLAAVQLKWLHLSEARRLQADGQPNAAVAAADTAARAAEEAQLGADERAEVYALIGRLRADEGEADPARRVTAWPQARGPLEKAVELAPGSADAWRWRFALGKIEFWAGTEENKAGRGEQAADHYALSVNHLRSALFWLYALKQQDPRLEPVFKDFARDMLKINTDIDQFLQKLTPAAGSALQAVRRLAKLDVALDVRQSSALTEAECTQMDQYVELVQADADKMDPKLRAAAEEFRERLAKYRPKK